MQRGRGCYRAMAITIQQKACSGCNRALKQSHARARVRLLPRAFGSGRMPTFRQARHQTSAMRQSEYHMLAPCHTQNIHHCGFQAASTCARVLHNGKEDAIAKVRTGGCYRPLCSRESPYKWTCAPTFWWPTTCLPTAWSAPWYVAAFAAAKGEFSKPTGRLRGSCRAYLRLRKWVHASPLMACRRAGHRGGGGCYRLLNS
jgi:hypothetical protein